MFEGLAAESVMSIIVLIPLGVIAINVGGLIGWTISRVMSSPKALERKIKRLERKRDELEKECAEIRQQIEYLEKEGDKIDDI